MWPGAERIAHVATHKCGEQGLRHNVAHCTCPTQQTYAEITRRAPARVEEVVRPGAVKRVAEEVEADELAALLGAAKGRGDVLVDLCVTRRDAWDIVEHLHERVQDARHLQGRGGGYCGCRRALARAGSGCAAPAGQGRWLLLMPSSTCTSGFRMRGTCRAGAVATADAVEHLHERVQGAQHLQGRCAGYCGRATRYGRRGCACDAELLKHQVRMRAIHVSG
jgi:hypothetical protein